MKKKCWIVICSILIVCFSTVFIIRYARLNSTYANPVIKTADIGQSLEVGEYSFCIEKWEWYTGDIVADIIPDYVLLSYNDGTPYPADKKKIILATVSISKNSGDDSYLDLTSITFESGAWHNQWDEKLYIKLNEGNSDMYLKLNNNENTTIVFPIVIYDFQFRKSEWESIENRVFSIVLSCYPEKLMLLGK